jgi:hypothetical protein
VIEIKVLRKGFGPKRDSVTEGCREMHVEQIHDLKFSLNTSQPIK